MIRLGFALLTATAIAGCTSLAPQACAPGQQAMLSAELLFGRKIGDRIGVSETDFRRFIDEEMTPRFPDGLTILDASGQYRDRERGGLIREPSKLVLIVLPDDAGNRDKLTAITEAYKHRFDQQSVGLILKPACASF
ncbi:conserved exported hypothetical protein [Bosea sp. 62]|uniref:DUF3574 domain-containing protein n=1 Tax=unclassified Bosea (in: a-proteobacteria) TaxID=2653178 RepID=UPI001256B179|nr:MULTISPECIES: DUF3574 domain-containing protein [unclassified Bosea (in: a-proteobacteria)]CAD5266781.1 conserved exported hypothetical protein [Bosea sp. 46]CAD5268289.1 conserved exported hypothetical protein [Bosea sp. 21B]CAD5270348.1 conserved exported hypothetical protein [Bosea sp. 7B]VVT62392.1 conserved exported hypothetical protein [Bosea sp. EC-HK365B]VXB90919.1 conserved exported hypothetical protein [Bosea sp. 29B]